MKKLIAFAFVVVAGLGIVNYAMTGEFSLGIPSFSKTEEEQAVQVLWEEVARAKKEFAQAHRTAATSGMDTSGDADAAISSVKRVKKELDALRKKLTEEKAQERAEQLALIVKDFVREVG